MKQKKPRNPFLKMMQNTRSIAFVRSKSTSGISGEVMRKQHGISIDENDVEKQFFKQNGKSDMLGIDIDPMDVFTPWYPLAPSIDRIDNSKGYTVDNFVINTRFENLGMQNCDPRYYDYVVEVLMNKRNNGYGVL
tara:strand:- start:119 stop:523 length:405 start_codon:yes stop_codon:yes gene_type:complete